MGGEVVEVEELGLSLDADREQFERFERAMKDYAALGRAIKNTCLNFDTLPTARKISLEEAKTVKGSVYFTKDGPIVWE